MLSEEERAEIEAEVAKYPTPEAAGMDALRIVQKHRGWVSDESLGEVAALLGVSAHQLDSVATFYNLIYRRPVGRHVILVCDSVSCWILGYERLRGRLQKRFGLVPGGTTADGRFTLLPMACLGACDRAPVVMVDEDTHRDLTPERLEEVLSRYE